MNKEEIISSGLLELYALGNASPEENRKAEESLALYPELREELDSIEQSLEAFAMAHGVKPPPDVRENLMKQIATTGNPQEPEENNSGIYTRSRFIFLRVLAAAMLLLMLGSVYIAYNYYAKYQNTVNELSLAQQKVQAQQEANLAMSEDLDVLTNRYTQQVVLKGTPQSPDAVAKIFWLKNTGEVYVDPTDLPAAPNGKQYQLWAIVDGKPVSAGLITTEKGTYSIQKMRSFGKAEAFAITLENAGGSPTPTMEQMVVISQL